MTKGPAQITGKCLIISYPWVSMTYSSQVMPNIYSLFMRMSMSVDQNQMPALFLTTW